MAMGAGGGLRQTRVYPPTRGVYPIITTICREYPNFGRAFCNVYTAVWFQPGRKNAPLYHTFKHNHL